MLASHKLGLGCDQVLLAWYKHMILCQVSIFFFDKFCVLILFAFNHWKKFSIVAIYTIKIDAKIHIKKFI